MTAGAAGVTVSHALVPGVPHICQRHLYRKIWSSREISKRTQKKTLIIWAKCTLYILLQNRYISCGIFFNQKYCAWRKITNMRYGPWLHQITNQKNTSSRCISKSMKVHKHKSTKVTCCGSQNTTQKNTRISDHQQIYIYSRHRSVRQPRRYHQSLCAQKH